MASSKFYREHHRFVQIVERNTGLDGAFPLAHVPVGTRVEIKARMPPKKNRKHRLIKSVNARVLSVPARWCVYLSPKEATLVNKEAGLDKVCQWFFNLAGL